MSDQQSPQSQVLACPFCHGPGVTTDGHTARCAKGETEMWKTCAGAFVRLPIAAWNTRAKPQPTQEAAERPITSLAYVAQLSSDQVVSVQRIVKQMDAYADALEAKLRSKP